MNNRPLLWLVVVLLAFLFLELCSYVVARVLLPTGLIVQQPDVSGYQEYLAQRDPVLGWPSPSEFGRGEYDPSGSRIVPAFPDAADKSCVALFGDSFTWGDEVAPEHAYGNVLAQLQGCRVANYGVGGYGTDQAAIRYMRVINDPAPVVVLGHFSDNITRNVNQLRDLIAGGRFGFKPRFILDGGKPSLVPLPSLTQEEYGSVVGQAGELLPHEFFRPGKTGVTAAMSFPYTLTLAQVAMHYRVVAAIRGIRPTYAGFYMPDHPSQALQVTSAIVAEAAAMAADRGQRFVFLLIPDLHDLERFRAEGVTSYTELRTIVASNGIEVVDAVDYMVAQHGDNDFCDLFVTCGASHFNPAGYRLLAEAVNAAL